MSPFRIYWWKRSKFFMLEIRRLFLPLKEEDEQKRNRINKREENVCEPPKVWIIYELEHRFFSHTLFINAMKLFRGVKYPLNWKLHANTSMNTFRFLGHRAKSVAVRIIIDLWHWMESIKKIEKKKKIQFIPLKV